MANTTHQHPAAADRTPEQARIAQAVEQARIAREAALQDSHNKLRTNNTPTT